MSLSQVLTSTILPLIEHNIVKNKVCLALEDGLYYRLDNFKNEKDMKYKALKQKQMAEEEEKRYIE